MNTLGDTPAAIKEEATHWIPRRLDRLFQGLRAAGAGAALLNSFSSLRYFAGYEAPIEWGPSPFVPCPGVLLCIPGEEPELLLAEGELLDPVPTGLSVSRFPGYTFREQINSFEELTRRVAQRLGRITCSTLAIEPAHVPLALMLALERANPSLRTVDVSTELAALRAIKDSCEIQLIREAVRLTDVGQRSARQVAAEGMSEIELFAEIHGAMESEAGVRVPLLADVISGQRTAEVGGSPSARKLKRGDLVIIDLVPRYKGVWGDSCNTFAIGEPTLKQEHLLDQVEDILLGLIDRVRQGVKASDLDAFGRARVAELGGTYDHHTGHGLGVTWHEEPRIVPYNSTELKPGMVIALEPGIYFEGQFGIRLESVVLVTNDGAEVLTKFQHRS